MARVLDQKNSLGATSTHIHKLSVDVGSFLKGSQKGRFPKRGICQKVTKVKRGILKEKKADPVF